MERMETSELHQVVEPAGFWVRLFANLLDAIIIGIPLSLLTYAITGSSQNSLNDTISTLYSLLVPVLWMGYTVGKRITGIRIVKINGEHVGLWTMIKRVVISAFVYAITLGIGLIVSLFMIGLRQDKRSLHDLIAGTYVTYQKPF